MADCVNISNLSVKRSALFFYISYEFKHYKKANSK